MDQQRAQRLNRIFDVSKQITEILSAYVDDFELDSDYDRDSEAIVVLNTIAAVYGLDRYIERPEV